jgi:hypothetical protein
MISKFKKIIQTVNLVELFDARMKSKMTLKCVLKSEKESIISQKYI